MCEADGGRRREEGRPFAVDRHAALPHSTLNSQRTFGICGSWRKKDILHGTDFMSQQNRLIKNENKLLTRLKAFILPVHRYPTSNRSTSGSAYYGMTGSSTRMRTIPFVITATATRTTTRTTTRGRGPGRKNGALKLGAGVSRNNMTCDRPDWRRLVSCLSPSV